MSTPVILPLTDLSQCCSLGAGPLAEPDAERYAQIFKVLADPARLRLLSQLTGKNCAPMTVGELTEVSGLSQPTVSHHLKKLADAGLISKSREGRTVTHSIKPEIFGELRTVLQMD